MTSFSIKFLTTDEVLAQLNMSKSSLYDRISKDNFPPPIKLTVYGDKHSRSTAARFIESEVHAYIRRKVEECRSKNPYIPTGKKEVATDSTNALKYLKSLRKLLDEYYYVLSKVDTATSLVRNEGLWAHLNECMTKMLPIVLASAAAFGIEKEGV